MPNSLWNFNRRVEGFYLATWASQHGILKILSISQQVQKLASTDLQVTFQKRIPLSSAQEGLELYQNNMTAGKILLVIDPNEVSLKSIMDITQTLYITNRKDWRNWLKKNYKTEKEIWLVYPRKATGKARIEYNDAVEEALCFGWIDSIAKKFDNDHTAQRFSPRRPKASYSQANIERLRYLVEKKMVIKEVLETLGDLLNEEFVIPPDILKAIKANKNAWKNFQAFSDSVCSDPHRLH